MTPEREGMIREAWSHVQPHLLDQLREGRAAQMSIDFFRPLRVGEFKAAPEMHSIEIVLLTPKMRERTWSVECEGLELGSYLR